HPSFLWGPCAAGPFSGDERRAFDRTSSQIGKTIDHCDSTNVRSTRAGRLCAYFSFCNGLAILDRACGRRYGLICLTRNCRASEAASERHMDLWFGCGVYPYGRRYRDDLFPAYSVAPRPLVPSTLCAPAVGNDTWKYHDRH